MVPTLALPQPEGWDPGAGADVSKTRLGLHPNLGPGVDKERPLLLLFPGPSGAHSSGVMEEGPGAWVPTWSQQGGAPVQGHVCRCAFWASRAHPFRSPGSSFPPVSALAVKRWSISWSVNQLLDPSPKSQGSDAASEPFTPALGPGSAEAVTLCSYLGPPDFRFFAKPCSPAFPSSLELSGRLPGNS